MGAAGVDDGLALPVGEAGDVGVAEGGVEQGEGHGAGVGGVGGAGAVGAGEVCFAAGDDELGF